MARFSEQSKLLQMLSEGATVKSACQKMGLNRTTYYSWYKNNIDFRNHADEAIVLGKHSIRDLAFSTVVKEAHGGNLKASIFLLQHYDPDFKPVRTTYVDPVNHKHELRAGEVCRSCGYMEPNIEEYKKTEGRMNNEVLVRHLIERLRVKDTGKKRNEKEIRKIVEDYVEENNLKIQVEVFPSKRTPEEAMKEGEKSEDPIIKGNI
jgi:hypothetical protein